MPSTSACLYCHRAFDDHGMRCHVAQKGPCRDRYRNEFFTLTDLVSTTPTAARDEPNQSGGELALEVETDDAVWPGLAMDVDPPGREEVSIEEIRRGVPFIARSQRRPLAPARANDRDSERFRSGVRYAVRPFQGQAAHTFGDRQLTPFEQLRNRQQAARQSIYYPFADADEWRFVEFISQHLGSNAIEEMLHLPFLKRAQPSFTSSYKFFQALDQLEQGPTWICERLAIQGNLLDDDGMPIIEELELWRRDALEVVRDLISNPTFVEHIEYEPQNLYADEACTSPIVGEMCTARWMHELQRVLPKGATIAGVVVSSDSTRLSMFRNHSVWPVYATVANIDSLVRRKPSSHSNVLIGYIPSSKLAGFKTSSQRVAGWRLFHFCMRLILKSLEDAGQDGVKMLCGDGCTRHIWPILAAYCADYPEQVLVTCTRNGRCPRCIVPAEELGKYPLDSVYRDVGETLQALDLEHGGTAPPYFDADGIRPGVYAPFWSFLPHCNIFACQVPDKLHEGHKGLFFDHLFRWIRHVVGDAEIDARFRAMNPAFGLRQFKKGISHVKQWTMGEHKQMEKVLLGLMSGAAGTDVIKAGTAVLNVLYASQFDIHTEATQTYMDSNLATFHQHKAVFGPDALGPREHFNIPKLHKIGHWPDSIWWMGALPGYDTETSERLHIDYAKNAYRRTNKRDYVEQMTVWLRRQEAIARRQAYISWMKGDDPAIDTEDLDPSDESKDNDGSKDDEYDDAKALLGTAGPDILGLRHHFAKTAPFARMSVAKIAADFIAPNFIEHLTAFLAADWILGIRPSAANDVFDVYRQVTVSVPANPYRYTRPLDRVRATPGAPAKGRSAALAGRFDTVLVIQDPRTYRLIDGLKGLRVARVRVLFDLPKVLGKIPTRLAYVDWFTEFQRRDTPSGVYRVKPAMQSVQQNIRRSEVIRVDRILRACHLLADPGASLGTRWTADTALDLAPDFLFNSWYTVDLFAFVNFPAL